MNNGFHFFKNYLSREKQELVLKSVENLIDKSQPFINRMWNGQPFKVINANAGLYGWYSNGNKGYSYINKHPETNQPWEPIPDIILKTIKELMDIIDYKSFKPECCYINLYPENGSLGLHRDDTESNLTAPIVSISLGDTAEFHLGGLSKTDKMNKILLESGDCYIQGGESRLYYHSIKKILYNSSDLISDGGRINLTVRQVY